MPTAGSGVLEQATFDEEDLLNRLVRGRPLAGRIVKGFLGDFPSMLNNLKTLIVEDDFSSRLILQTFLSHYGECHIAVNGREAVEAFRSALESGQAYGLVCMDIMMPEMDGREAVKQVRALEQAYGIPSTSDVKIIMTTA